MKWFLQKILRKLAIKTLAKYSPTVIGITGSVGKTSTKEAVYGVLSLKFPVRKNESNYNNDIGVPLTVLGIRPLESKNIFERIRFMDDIIGSIWNAYSPFKKEYPLVLVLELGADKPNDISYLVDIVKPSIGVVTAVGDVPVHVEFYSSAKEVANEKSKLIKALPEKGGLAVLNYDDEIVLKMKQLSPAPVVTIGNSKDADFYISGLSYFSSDNLQHVGGLSFKIHNKDGFIPVKLYDMIAPHQINAVLIATAIGVHMGMNMVDIVSCFERIVFPKGRMRLINGIRGSILIDDTYNASPLSTHAGLSSLKPFAKASKTVNKTKKRSIAILGDMKELGRYTESAHRAIGDFVSECADIVIGIGPASAFITENAKIKMSEKRVLHFHNVEESIEIIKDLIKENDIIYIKGSQSIRMEKLTKALMESPEKAKDLLVRQDEKWR